MISTTQLIDLTDGVPGVYQEEQTVKTEEWVVQQRDKHYIANVYRFNLDSMLATYIDFPGHIKETDDGWHAGNYPLEKLYRIPTSVACFERTSGSGPVTADDLQAALPDGIDGKALVINGLGSARYDSIAFRSVYLTADAADWIVQSGVHLLVSDIYESDSDPQGVFPILFSAGISTICQPVNLDRLPVRGALLTVLPLRFPGITQIPCRALAEIPVMK